MKEKGILDRIVDSMAFLAGALLVAAVLIVCFEIFMRYFAQRPQVWTVEICEYILFSLAFLGAPWLLKVGGHVSIDIFLTQFGPKARNYFGLFSAAIGTIVSVVICWFSIATSYDCYKSGVLMTKTLSIPKHYFLILITLGYLLLFFVFARQFIAHFKRLRGKN